MTKNGGYVIIDLNDTTKIYKQALGCLKSGKPVLVYDAPNIYYADTIAKVGDDVVITKGGKTITIKDANSVSSEGIVKAPTMENIVDLAGNKRFVEGDIELTLESGFDTPYAKWSLSGTHLMIVIVISGENTAVHSAGTIATIDLPKYINDKIVRGLQSILERKNIILYASDSTTQSVNVEILKDPSDNVKLYMSAITMSADRQGRIQFDLLIDAD